MFGQIKYLKLLFETLREYFSVNVQGNLSILYRFCASCLQVLQPRWEIYDTFRQQSKIIAQCKWSTGQLTNTLNYLFDNLQNRIYITQAIFINLFASDFNYQTQTFTFEFGDAETPIYVAEFDDTIYTSKPIVNIPSDVSATEVKNVCDQIIISGIDYQINTI